GCDFSMPGLQKGSPSSSSGFGSANAGGVALTAAAYQKSVYAYVTTQGCANCHANGPAPQADWFASSDLSTAFSVALLEIDMKNIPDSPFAQQVSSDHCGNPSICGVSDAQMISALNEWVALSAQTPASSPGSNPTSIPTSTPTGTTSCGLGGQLIPSGSSAQA